MAVMRIGVLALQGAFREHRRALGRLGVDTLEVRLPEHLKGLSGLIIPGGESTTMMKLMETYGFDRAIPDFYRVGGAVWGTCAGAITLASELPGYEEQPRLALLPVAVCRNAYGRQIDSFEADLEVAGGEGTFHGVFIRAPRITSVGEGVEVLSRFDGDPVLVRYDRVLASIFHPELSGDDRIHLLFVQEVCRPTV